MRKLKFDFHKTKKYIISALATTMLTTFLSGCSSGVENKQYDPNTYTESVITETVELENENIQPEIVIEDSNEEINEEIDVGVYIDKLVISSVEDIEAAKQYDTIKYLKIDKANITDFSFLKDINVELLQVLHNNSPIDMECINSKAIKQLYFHNVAIENEQECSNFKNLENFVLKSNQNNRNITNLEFLSECKKMTNIEIQNYGITDLSFVRNMKELKNLSVINSSIQDISDIKNCKEIASLTLKQGKIEDISALKNLSSLQSVDLEENYITDISGINTENLCYLNLTDNLIKDASSLENSDTLTAVNLSKNYISKLPSHIIKDGMSLDVSYNNIEKLSNTDKDIMQNTNLLINMFDNKLDINTVKEISQYPTVYFEADNGALSTEQAIDYSKKINELLSTMNKGEDTENIIKINKYILENCRLDYTYVAENKDNAYGALFDQSVCTGMTDLTNSLCRHLNIEAKEYHGDLHDSTDNERHVWTVYKIDGKWYHCDGMQNKANRDDKEYPKIVMLSDEEVQQYGHILDALNAPECNSEISKETRDNIINKIENQKTIDSYER